LPSVYAPEIPKKHPQQLEAYKRMPDSVLFRVQEVRVDISEYDLPGPTRRKVTCGRCGQVVRDNREVIQNSYVFCKPCAEGAYFSDVKEETWPDMNWTPDQKELAFLGHGGLCRDCPECTSSHCAFGKGN